MNRWTWTEGTGKGKRRQEMHPYIPMVRGIMPCRGIKLSSRPSRPPYRECEIRRSWSSREVFMVWGPSGLPGVSCKKRKEAGGIRIIYFLLLYFSIHFFRLCPWTFAECMESIFGCRQTKEQKICQKHLQPVHKHEAVPAAALLNKQERRGDGGKVVVLTPANQ